MFKNIYLILFVSALLTGCNKNAVKPIIQPQPIEYTGNTPYTVDSLLLAGKPEQIRNFYAQNGYLTIWTSPQDRAALLTVINTIQPDGLQPKDYNVAAITGLEARKKSLNECIAYDLLLTESFYQLANHLFRGKVSPESVYTDWELQNKKLDTGKLLYEALYNHTVAETLDKCRPPHPVYAGLRKSFEYLNALPADTAFTAIPYTKTLNLNNSHNTLPDIKKRLAYWKDLTITDSITTKYDVATFEAVKKFQARHGLHTDGKIDSKTIKALNISREERLSQVLVNLERWKWFAYDFGEKAVVINIAGYELAVIENGRDTIQLHKVIVGKPERRTPVLDSKLNYLVLNPTWTVPPTILKEDLIPSATEDRNYFAKHNMKIYDYSKNEISPWAWNPEEADKYYYVQGPGTDNALGEIKFNFNNKHAVYLHDTNHREQFKKVQRAFSSGCVRVHNPLKLAQCILKDEKGQWSKEKLQEIIAAQETKTVTLTKNNAIHQLYWTAWMDSNGLQFRDDIYKLDNILYKKLRN